MHISRSTIIEQLAQTVDAGKFEDHLQPQPYQKLIAASLGGLAVLFAAAAFLTALA